MPLLMGACAHAQEYKEISRTYVNFTNMDFSECIQTFRFINGNYMDCHRQLPLSTLGRLEKITSTRYPMQNFNFPISGTDLEFYMRIETSGSNSSDERIWISGYYMKKGQLGLINTLSPEYYTSAIFMSYLKQLLLQISQRGGWISEWPFIAIPEAPGNSMVEDKTLDSIYVARRKMDLNIDDCKKSFHSWEADAWPDEDYWVSDCFVVFLPDHSPIPLYKSDWGADLQPAVSETLSEGAGTLSYSTGGYTISFIGKKSWDEIKTDVEAILHKAHYSVYGYFIIRGAELGTLTEKDELLGHLVRRDGLLGISAQ